VGQKIFQSTAYYTVNSQRIAFLDALRNMAKETKSMSWPHRGMRSSIYSASLPKAV